MNSKSREQLQEEFQALNDLYRQGVLTANIYYKCLVCLAWEHLSEDEVSQAVSLLNIPPKEYYTDVQPEQMLADAAYFEVALDVANALVDRWLVSLDSGLAPNQRPASA